MKRPTIIEGILVAALLAGLSIPLMFIARLLFWHPVGVKTTIACLGALYLMYLLGKTSSYTGKLVPAVVCLLALVLSVAGLMPLGVLLMAVGIVWLFRAFLAYSSIFPAILDAAICVASIGLALSVFSSSFSFAAAVWTFFLVQALFTLIPTRFKKRDSSLGIEDSDACAVRFANAYNTAQQAVARMAEGV